MGEAAKAVAGGAEILVIGDRRVGPRRAPIPSLLAVAAVHHELVRAGLRTRCSLVVDSGEPREVHHVACLVGYGADAVHRWLAGDEIVPALGHGAAEDDVQDGRLDRLRLPRRAGVRGDRARRRS